jgi:hypothetical protein
MIKQSGGRFIPCTDQDMEALAKLKNGTSYCFEIKQIRNYEFHKKYFALISCTWDCLNDEEKEFFRSSEIMRKTIERCAGHCDRIYSLKEEDFRDIPKSISFSSMDETAFQSLYDNVKNVIFSYILKGKISEEDFMNHLINF